MKEIYGIEQLDELIFESIEQGKVICLYFGAKWCGPCKQLKTRLVNSETIKIMPKLVVGYLDVDEEINIDLVKRYNIESLPTQIFIKLDKNKVIPVSKIEGYDFNKLTLEYNSYLAN